MKFFGYRKIIVVAFMVVVVFATVFWAVRTASDDGTNYPEIALVSVPPTLSIPDFQVAPPESVTVPILVYHKIRSKTPAGLSAYDRLYEVTPKQFTEEMEYLSENGYQSVSFDLLGEYLAGGEGEWPDKPVLITLDDGRRSQFENAWPVLKRLGLTATFFVFTNAPDHNDDYMTWAELSELKSAGNEIGSHTVLHPYLTKSDDEELEHELRKSREDIESGVGVVTTSLAYPFGLSDERVNQAASEVGYVTARGLGHFTEITAQDLMNLPGYIVTGNFGSFKKILGE